MIFGTASSFPNKSVTRAVVVTIDLSKHVGGATRGTEASRFP